ncbi:MAG TPA: IPT/TIG domain-containing protein, partial [Chitinophagaceae bacterium]
MKSIRLLLALMLAGSSVLFNACSKDEQEPPFITVHKQTIHFYEYYSGDTLFITSNVPWQLTVPLSDTSWLQPYMRTGEPGTTEVRFAAMPNAGLPRTSTVTIVSLGDPVPPIVIPVTQSHRLDITDFTPSAPGGATITIDGTGFSSVPSENIVKINGVVAAVQSATNKQLKVVVPPQAGVGKLVVQAGNQTDTASKNFIYEWTAMVSTVAGSTLGYQDG